MLTIQSAAKGENIEFNTEIDISSKIWENKKITKYRKLREGSADSSIKILKYNEVNSSDKVQH